MAGKSDKNWLNLWTSPISFNPSVQWSILWLYLQVFWVLNEHSEYPLNEYHDLECPSFREVGGSAGVLMCWFTFWFFGLVFFCMPAAITTNQTNLHLILLLVWDQTTFLEMSLEELHPDKAKSFSTKGLCSAATWGIPAKTHLAGQVLLWAPCLLESFWS